MILGRCHCAVSLFARGLVALVVAAALAQAADAGPPESGPFFGERTAKAGGRSTENTDQSPSATLVTPVRLPWEKMLPGPVTDYEIVTATGGQNAEYLLRKATLSPDGFRYVEKAGRGCANIRPWLLVRNTKTQGGVAVSLAYSGNWRMEVQPRGEQTLLRVATSPATLPPFDTIAGLPIPGALVAEFTGHWDNGTQPIVRFIRGKLLRNLGEKWPIVQYNNWYGYDGTFTEKSLYDAAAKAAQVGCELFTVDAGWYGASDKLDWSQQVGDWRVNRARLPKGLEPIAAEVRRRGMMFGLWVEIENASPNSPVGKAHPDWYLRDGKTRLSNRGTLDFGNPQVLAWAKSEIDRLVTTYKLDYLKMDFNTNPTCDSEKFAPGQDPLYRHYRGLMELWKHLRVTYPQLVVENCSSGSQRADVMTAALTDTHWVSDNIHNEWNLAQNVAATYLFPPEICSHWTALPSRTAKNDSLDLESQFTVNMMGHFGLSGRIQDWDAETLKIAAERIALYKKIRPLLRVADVYHLTEQADPARPGTVQAVLYVEPQTTKAILFAFQGGDPQLQATLRLRGLHAGHRYRILPPAAFGPETSLTGGELMETGVALRFPHRGASAVIPIEAR